MALLARPRTAARPRPADVLDGMVHYHVDTPDGPVGVVDGWERDEHARPQALIVAQGWFGRRRFEVPFEKLIEIDHEHKRVVLAPGAAALEQKGPLHRLVDRGPDRQAGAAPAAVTHGPDKAPPVVCGVADDQQAPTVVAVAARLARKLEAPLVVAHVTPAHIPPGVSAAADGQARLREEEHEHADELIDTLLSGLAAGADVKRVVARGTPAETLEELAGAERAQLLVVGATGKGSLGTLLKGSVSRQVTGRARCPVVVVPPDLKAAEDGREGSSDIQGLAGAGPARTSR